MNRWWRDHSDAKIEGAARVQVRLHERRPHAPASSTAAGRDGNALLLVWMRACWDARRRA